MSTCRSTPLQKYPKARRRSSTGCATSSATTRRTTVRSGARVEHEVGASVVEANRRSIAKHRHPHLGLVDHVQHPAAVGRHGGCRRGSIGPVSRQPAHATTAQRLGPQVTVDGHIDHRRPVGGPTPAPATEAATRTRWRERRQLAHRRAVERVDHQCRRPGRGHGVHETSAARIESGLGEIS